MKAEDIKPGQIWQRKNGAKVIIGHERHWRGNIEWQLIPTTIGPKSRISWKWNGGIINELTFVSN